MAIVRAHLLVLLELLFLTALHAQIENLPVYESGEITLWPTSRPKKIEEKNLVSCPTTTKKPKLKIKSRTKHKHRKYLRESSESSASENGEKTQIINKSSSYESGEANSTTVFNVTGVVPAVFTPMNDDQTVNTKVIPAYAKYLAEKGIRAVLVGGTAGEHMSLSVESRKAAIDAWLFAKVNTGLHIQVQVGGTNLQDVLTLAKYCARAGVDSILTLPELYFRPTTVSELVSYVKLVADAAPNLPILYYHTPHLSKVNLKMPEFVEKATKTIPSFSGLKFSSKDLSTAQQVLKVLKKNQVLFMGGEKLLAPAAMLGINSCIGGSVNYLPQVTQDILKAVQDGEIEKATELQNRVSSIIKDVTSKGGLAATRVAVESVSGIKLGSPALPNVPVSEEAREEIGDIISTNTLTCHNLSSY